MRLRYQLFLTLLLTSATLIAIMVAFNTWNFNRGFSNYVIDNEKQRLKPTINQLAYAYDRYKSWDWLKNDRQALDGFLDPVRRNLRDGRDLGNRRDGQTGRARRDQEVLGGEQQRPTPNRAPPRPGGPRPRILLADENHIPLLGDNEPPKNVVWVPINWEDTTVGYLGIREPNGLPGELDLVFASQQLRSFAYTAVAMFLLSGLIAVALSSRIVKPILNLSRAVGHISGGDFQQRIENNSQDEIGDLSRNINQLARTLERNLKARQQWMAEISHELRTPVAILQGEIEAIQDGVNPLDQKAIESLHAESTRLGRLIDDLHELTLSDMGALNYQMEPLNLFDLVEQRVQSARPLTSEHKLSVSLNKRTPIIVQADPQRLAQLIDNLLQNSVRYTDEGGAIEVSLSRKAGNAILEWVDSSPGVTAEQLPNLFEPLYRTEGSRSREFGGSGLGLSIVEKIVTAHQGQINAFHSPLGGLGIKVMLPI